MGVGGRLSLGKDREIRKEKGRLLTLIGGLRRLRDIDSQLSTEGIHAHHPCVDRSVSEGRELAVVARDTVQGLCDVSRSLQNDLLKSKADIPFSAPIHTPRYTTFQSLTIGHVQGLPWLTSWTPASLNKPVSLFSSSPCPYHKWGIWGSEQRRPRLRRHPYKDRAGPQNPACLTWKAHYHSIFSTAPHSISECRGVFFLTSNIREVWGHTQTHSHCHPPPQLTLRAGCRHCVPEYWRDCIPWTLTQVTQQRSE